MMSNSVPESAKEILTGCVSFYTQWFDVCVCIRVRGLHLVFLCRNKPGSSINLGIMDMSDSSKPMRQRVKQRNCSLALQFIWVHPLHLEASRQVAKAAMHLGFEDKEGGCSSLHPS